jgi:signal transduction histidine kinase/CheY-like chemotaxis protein
VAGSSKGLNSSLAFLQGENEMARLILALDWSSSLGPIDSWPASLKTTVGLMLRSPVPLVLLWGPDGIMLYNDAYGGFAGNRHPGILGAKVLEAWPEAADLNTRVMAVCMAGGTLQYKDERLVLNRRGTPEEAWMDLFYSPVIDESGHPGGVIAVVVETTERVLARRAAVAQSERLAQMFEDAPSFMALLEGPEHRFIFSNAAYQQLIAGRTIIGKPIREALPEIAGQGLYELLDKVYRSGASFRGHARPVKLQWNPNAAPEERLLDFIYQPVRNSAGTITGIFVEGIDVTDSARAVAALEKNEARLRFLDKLSAAIASSQDADAILAITTRFVGEYLGVSICAYADMDDDADGFTIRGDWSAPGSASIVGHYNLANFGRKAVTELSAGRPLIINDNQQELESSEAATFENLGVGATICMPLVKEGRLTALMAIHHKEPHLWTDHELALIREVTERSWAHIERVRDEVARRESAERLSLAAHVAQIGIFDFNPISGELVWDDRCKELFGLPVSASVSYNVFLAGLHPDDREKTDAAVKDALDPAVRAPYDIEYRTIGMQDGVERWIAATGHVFFRDEAAVRFVGTVLDVSTQKEAAAALADINATLEKRVEERTSQLRRTEEALRQSQKMEAVGQLTGGIAHDFNNLLQGITGALERAQRRIETGRTPEAERYIKMAVDSASRAAALTHRLLAFSRRQTLDPRPTDINRLIAGMEELIRRTMGPDVKVEVVGAGGLWAVHVDISQLENSLLNLCINARDAMPDGGKLTIETANKWLDDRTARERDLPPGQYVSLCVTDTGTGMTPDVIARAFDPFFTTKPLGRGTGLGLSMIYGYVRQSGGQVRIYSEAGKGTTMCLYLPRYLGEVEEEEQKPSDLVERGFGETVLVVDDEEDIRMLISEVLSENYYNILEANDGAAALKILAGKRPVHLLVTDVGLPGGMNGRQLAEAARLARKDLKVLFITGYAENAAVGSGHLEPGMQVLAKPFAMSTLANKVREMLESRGQN